VNSGKEIFVIKRYANRKLYDTVAARYVTLEEIGDMLRCGEDVTIIDHRTNLDITNQMLLQVLVESEKRVPGSIHRSALVRMIAALDSNSGLTGKLRGAFNPHLDPIESAEDELRHRIEILVESGVMTEKEGQAFLSKLLSESVREAALIRANEIQRQARMDLQTQFNQLSRQVSELEELLNNLQENVNTEK
jgi:polyhydroxyalkanoate synthesis repressor PhaR